MTLIPDWIDAELRNWSAWCWSGAWPHPLPPSHCASIEHRYAAPSDLSGPAEPRPIAPNRQRAEVVHRVYLDQLTERERRVLVLAYVQRNPWQAIPRLMRFGEAAARTALFAAARRVGDAFREERVR